MHVFYISITFTIYFPIRSDFLINYLDNYHKNNYYHTYDRRYDLSDNLIAKTARQGLIPNLILTPHLNHPTHNPTKSWRADTTKKVANSRPHSFSFSSADRTKLLTNKRQSSIRTPHSLNTPVSFPRSTKVPSITNPHPTELNANRYKYFRWNARTAKISFIYVILIPGALMTMALKTEVCAPHCLRRSIPGGGRNKESG